MMRRSAGFLIGGAISCAICATDATSYAQTTPISPSKLPERSVTVARDPVTKRLRVTFGFQDVADAEVQRKLQSGLTTVIVVAGGFFDAAGDDSPLPGSGVWQSCRVTFDVWNEVYRLQIARSDGNQNAVAVNLKGVLRRCAEVSDLVVHGALVPGTRYFLAATVEVNPVSQEMLEQIRRWVSRPPGSSAASPGESLFGSFVGMFVARVGRADRTIHFRTHAFAVPP